jgi:hypothetical protein
MYRPPPDCLTPPHWNLPHPPNHWARMVSMAPSGLSCMHQPTFHHMAYSRHRNHPATGILYVLISHIHIHIWMISLVLKTRPSAILPPKTHNNSLTNGGKCSACSPCSFFLFQAIKINSDNFALVFNLTLLGFLTQVQPRHCHR